jgi:hypothetical protein
MTLSWADRMSRIVPRWSGEAVEGFLEAIVLAEHALDGGVVPEQQRVAHEVHLQAQGVLDLPGVVDPLARLVQETALPRHGGDRPEAHAPHRDQEQGDQEKRAEELRVHRGAEPSDPAHERSERPGGQEEARDSLAQARRRFRDRTGGPDAAFTLVGHAARLATRWMLSGGSRAVNARADS